MLDKIRFHLADKNRVSALPSLVSLTAVAGLIAALTVTLVLLAGCEIYPPTANPNYTIGVMQTPNGMVAVPPSCPNWSTVVRDPYDSQPDPQFGCANARNLAMMVAQPSDLIHGRDEGDANAVTTVGAMRRYDNNQTRGLLWTGSDPNYVAVTTAPTAASSMTGDAAGGSGAAASPAASAAPAASP